MRNILYVIGSLNRGGAEIHLLRILPKLSKDEFSPKIFLLTQEGELAEEFRKQGVDLITPWIKGGNSSLLFGVFRMALTCVQLFLYFLLKRPDIVHFFLPASYLIGGPLAILSALPKRIMSRRSLNDYQKKFPAFVANVEKWLHQRMNLVLGNSQRVVDQLVEEEGLSKARVKLLYNGVTLPSPAAIDMRAELGLDKESLVYIITANLIPYKGHADLLEAFALANIQQKWDLLVVGHDSAKIQSELAAQANRLNISEHVHFLGARRDISDLLHCSDIGILCSHEEGFSNAILEGMAAGLPMIVTDVGGNAEAVLDQKNGLVVPSRDPVALGAALKKLAEQPELRTEFGKAGKRRQQEEFSLEACVEAYENMYRHI